MSKGAELRREISSLGRPRSAAGNFQRHRPHLFMDEAVGGEDDGTTELIRVPGKITDSAAGFFHEQDARGGIPLLKIKFPESVKAPSSHASKIECGGAIAANTVGALGEVAVILQIRARLAVAHGKTGAEETGGDGGVPGDADFLAVERGAFAAGRGEKFIAVRIKDDSGEKRVTLREGKGDAEAGIAVGEIGGAVERIHVPAELGGRFLASAFFGGNGVFRKIFDKARDDELFGAFVGLGDKVYFVAFV